MNLLGFSGAALIAATVTVGGLVGGAETASAATVSEFSTYASARVWIESAYLAGTRIDARDLLYIDDIDDDSFADDYATPGSYANGWANFGSRGEGGPGFLTRHMTEGSASGSPSLAYATGVGYNDFSVATGEWCNGDPVLCAMSLDLTFGYELEIDLFVFKPGPRVGTASAGAGGMVWFGSYDTAFYLGESLEVTNRRRVSHSQTVSGLYSMVLDPDAPFLFGVEVGGGGEIDLAPPPPSDMVPVPLPASLPLLGAGLAGLAALGRMRRRRG